MQKILSLLVFVTAGLIILLSGCGGPPPPEWESLNRYDFNVAVAEPDFELPAAHLYEMIYFSRVASGGGHVSDSTIAEFRDSVLVDTLLSFEADKFDLRQRWYYQREYRDQYHQMLRSVFWDSTVVPFIEIDSSEITEFYEANKDAFSVPEQALVYHILASPIGFAQNRDSSLVEGRSRDELSELARVYIERLHRLLDYGMAFENVAYQYSHDVRSRDRGGLLGWTTPGTYIDPFDSVAFSLEPGTYSKPYRDADGYHILYVEDYVPPGPLPLDSVQVRIKVRQELFNRKAAERAGAIIDSLRKVADIEINEDVLDTNIYYVEDSTWSVILNETDTVDALRLKGVEEDYRRMFGVDSTTREIRLMMVDNVISPFLVVQAARSRGLDTLPEVVERETEIRFATARKILLGDLYSPVYVPSDSAVKAYYQAHLDEYWPTRHLEVEQLIVQDHDLAEYLREQAQTGLELPWLQEYYSNEGYNVEYEYVGIIEKGKVDSAFYAAAENTLAHRVARIVKTERGYHLIKVISRKHNRPLEMAYSEIQSILIDQHRRQFYEDYRDRLFAEYNVEFPGLLPPFDLPRLSDRNHPRTLLKKR